MKIVNSLKFERSLKKLPYQLVGKVVERTLIFEKDPFDSRLETHKLHGKLKNEWSFSIDKKNRILFEFIGRGAVLFLDVGDHDLYK